MKNWNPDVLRLYLVTDDALSRGRKLVDIVEAAVNGGVSCVQLREKQLSTKDFLQQAHILKRLLTPYKIPLVINDRVDIALACGAEGMHLGQSDMPVVDARKILPAHVFIGWSVETLDQVAQAARLPVDYLGVSPVFATPTKTDTHKPWGLKGLSQVRGMTALPLVAIGGININTISSVFQAGADGVAVVSAICAASDPQAAAHHLRQLCEAPS